MTELACSASNAGWVKPLKNGSIGFLLANMEGKVRGTRNM